MKKCTKCGLEKPEIDFGFYGASRPGKIKPVCKSCCAAQLRVWHKKNPEKKHEYDVKHYWKDPDKARKHSRDYYRNHQSEQLKIRKQRREAHLEEARAAQRVYHTKNKEYRKKYSRERKQSGLFRKQENARAMVYQWVKKGKLHRPDKCPICFQEKQIQGHHINYDFPLSVLWVCPSCHADLDVGRITVRYAISMQPDYVDKEVLLELLR